jgi:hypothetical protein
MQNRKPTENTFRKRIAIGYGGMIAEVKYKAVFMFIIPVGFNFRMFMPRP